MLRIVAPIVVTKMLFLINKIHVFHLLIGEINETSVTRNTNNVNCINIILFIRFGTSNRSFGRMVPNMVSNFKTPYQLQEVCKLKQYASS